MVRGHKGWSTVLLAPTSVLHGPLRAKEDSWKTAGSRIKSNYGTGRWGEISKASPRYACLSLWILVSDSVLATVLRRGNVIPFHVHTSPGLQRACSTLSLTGDTAQEGDPIMEDEIDVRSLPFSYPSTFWHSLLELSVPPSHSTHDA